MKERDGLSYPELFVEIALSMQRPSVDYFRVINEVVRASLRLYFKHTSRRLCFNRLISRQEEAAFYSEAYISSRRLQITEEFRADIPSSSFDDF